MGKRMKYYIVFAFVVLSNLCFAQLDSTDYFYYRNLLKSTTCGVLDSSVVERDKYLLEHFDISRCKKNTEHYYYDLGMTYYALCLITNDRSLKEKQIQACQKALEINPRFNSGHWLIATSYSDIGNCDKAKKHFKKYRKYTPKAEIDYHQIGVYLENCP